MFTLFNPNDCCCCCCCCCDADDRYTLFTKEEVAVVDVAEEDEDKGIVYADCNKFKCKAVQCSSLHIFDCFSM